MKQTLVLVPGMSGDEKFWQFQISHLSDIADIVVPDISECVSQDEMVEKVLSCIDGSFALAGVSMGGWAGFKLAAQSPERVTKFAPIATWARPIEQVEVQFRKLLSKLKGGFFKEFIAKYDFPISPARKRDTAFIDFLARSSSKIREKVFIRHLEAYLNDIDSRDFLPKIKCPTLVIAGRDDPFFTVEEHEYIAQSIKGARLAIIEDCGHYLPLERPYALSALLRYWLMYY